MYMALEKRILGLGNRVNRETPFIIYTLYFLNFVPCSIILIKKLKTRPTHTNPSLDKTQITLH